MRTLLTSAAAALFLALPVFADETKWEIDGAHANAGFAIRHMMVSTVRGSFGKVSGTVTYDGKDPSTIQIDASIDVSSVNTGIADRDAHLKSPDFFDVAKFPTMTFKSKKSEAAGAGKFKVTGDLTIHGVTKEVVLEGEGPTAPVKDPWGNTRIGASATTKILRSEFGLVWNKLIEAGGVAVGDEVSITIDIEVTPPKAPEKAPEKKPEAKPAK